MSWQDQKPSWHVFHQVGAEDRMKIHDEVQAILNKTDGNSIQLTDWQMWVLKEVFHGGSRWCERCEQNMPELLMFEKDEEDSPEYNALLLLDVEYSACACCVKDVREERRCRNCGMKESWLAWREDKSCSRSVGIEQVFFDDHDWADFDQRVESEVKQ